MVSSGLPQRTMVVDMVPMVNIVFLLLVFFMISGQLREQTLDSRDAPTTLREHEPVPTQGDRVVVVVDVEGWVRIERGSETHTFATWTQVRDFLATVTARERIISAHRDAPSGAVHHILAALQAEQGAQARTLLLVVQADDKEGG